MTVAKFITFEGTEGVGKPPPYLGYASVCETQAPKWCRPVSQAEASWQKNYGRC